MELGEFIQKSLNEVLDSVESIDNKRGGGILSFRTFKDEKWSYGEIDFDIAVVVEKDIKSEGAIKGGVGIKVLEAIDVASLRGDLKSGESHKTSNASRIRFTVGIDNDFLCKDNENQRAASDVVEDIY